jgi:hypothetical protein
MKVGAIHTNFPNRGQVAPPESEAKASAIRRKADPLRPPGDRNQFPSVGAVGVSHVNVRPFRKGELAAIWRPDTEVTDNIRETAGRACGHGESPELRFGFCSYKISRQEVGMRKKCLSQQYS